MTYSKITINATGGKQDYNVTFPAISDAHIFANVDGSPVTTFTITGDYTTGAAVMTFSAPIFAGGEVIEIYRSTGVVPIVDYQSGSSIREDDLDVDALQALNLHEEQAQEVADTYQALSEKGQPDGYAELDSSGLVPVSQLGSGTALSTTYLSGLGTWQPVTGGGGGGGDVTSPGLGSVAVDEVAAYGNTDGTLLKPTGVLVTAVLTDADVVSSGTPDGVLGTTSGYPLPADLGTGSPSITTFLCGDGSWKTVSGTGDVSGPSLVVDNEIVLFDGTTGKQIKSAAVTLAAYLPASQKGAALGLAPLDAAVKVPILNLGGSIGGTPSDYFLRGDQVWAVPPAGGGGVNGPGAVTSALQVAVWADGNGDQLDNALVEIDSLGNITLPATATVDGRDVSVDGVSLDALVAVQGNIPTSNEKAALSGTSGTPVSSGNPLVDDTDERLDPFIGADDPVVGTDGSQGLVPSPIGGEWLIDRKFLGASGNWEVIDASWLIGSLGISAGGTAGTSYDEAFYNLAPKAGAAATNQGALIVRKNVAGTTADPWTYLARGADDLVLLADSTQPEGVRWGTVPGGSGTVTGPGTIPAASTVAIYGDTTGDLLADSLVDITDVERVQFPSYLTRNEGYIAAQQQGSPNLRFSGINSLPMEQGEVKQTELVTPNGYFLNYGTNNSASVRPNAGFFWPTPDLVDIRESNPSAWRFVIRTGPAITSVCWWIGLFSTNPTGRLISTNGLDEHWMAVRWNTSSDTNPDGWKFVTANNSNSSVSTSSVAVAADTIYVIDFYHYYNGAQWEAQCWIDGVLVATHVTGTDQLPQSGAVLAPAVRCTTFTAAVREILFQRHAFYFKG